VVHVVIGVGEIEGRTTHERPIDLVGCDGSSMGFFRALKVTTPVRPWRSKPPGGEGNLFSRNATPGPQVDVVWAHRAHRPPSVFRVRTRKNFPSGPRRRKRLQRKLPTLQVPLHDAVPDRRVLSDSGREHRRGPYAPEWARTNVTFAAGSGGCERTGCLLRPVA